jgi:hypothetical protein
MDQLAIDFADPAVAAEFRVINDDVMGGVSSARLRPVDGALRFEGTVSLENNGGFASFRGPVRLPASATALLVTLRGDGQRYKLTLKQDDDDRAPQYQARFTAPLEWSTIRFTPDAFSASFRGRAVAAAPLSLGQVRSLGVLISDGQAGAFGIELGSVRAD